MAACVACAAVVVVAAQSKPVTNADVIALAKAGMGEDVILAKINSSATDFKTDVADLKALKSAGLSDNVISTMVRRGTSPAPAAAPPASTGGGGRTSGTTGNQVVGGLSDVGVVTLMAKDGRKELRSAAGTISTTWAYVTQLVYNNFDGLKADVRTTDRRPSLVVKSAKSPRGRLYLVSAEVDTDNNVRSVKMGNSRLFGAKNIGAPDSDNQIECDVVNEGGDVWRMTPKKDLAPGEYGLWIQSNEMFDFGID
jgi:hypothetical protein